MSYVTKHQKHCVHNENLSKNYLLCGPIQPKFGFKKHKGRQFSADWYVIINFFKKIFDFYSTLDLNTFV